MNRFGNRFAITTFGESHGEIIGAVIDGVPSGLNIDLVFIQSEVERRRGGKNSYTTQRKESDEVEILSGVFEGKSTGTPIALIIKNENQKSKDYSNVAQLLDQVMPILHIFINMEFEIIEVVEVQLVKLLFELVQVQLLN